MPAPPEWVCGREVELWKESLAAEELSSFVSSQSMSSGSLFSISTVSSFEKMTAALEVSSESDSAVRRKNL